MRCTRFEGGQFDMFPLFKAEENSSPIILQRILDHLHALHALLEDCFPDLNVKEYDWIQNHFPCRVTHVQYDAESETIQLKNDRTL